MGAILHLHSVFGVHRIRPEFAVILNDSTHPEEVQKACEEILTCRERVLWTAGLEIVVAAVSFVAFDIRRSPLVPCVSSCLLLLATMGYHGALVLSQVETVAHTLLATSIAAAVCLAATSVFLPLHMHDLRQLNEESSISEEELEEQAMQAQGQDLCCVCVTEPKDAALVPCGHKAMCYNCACQVQARGLRCPICRNSITRVLRVFD